MNNILSGKEITTIDKRQIKKYFGRVGHEQMASIDDALKVSLGIEVPSELEAP